MFDIFVAISFVKSMCDFDDGFVSCADFFVVDWSVFVFFKWKISFLKEDSLILSIHFRPAQLQEIASL